MINVEIDAKNYDLDDDLRSRADDRIGGLDEFMSTLDEGRVKFSWEGGPNEQTKDHAVKLVTRNGDAQETIGTA